MTRWIGLLGALCLLTTACFEVPALPPGVAEADMCGEDGCDEPDETCEECLEQVEDLPCMLAECDDDDGCQIKPVECPIGQICDDGACVDDAVACQTPRDCGIPQGECMRPTCFNGTCGVDACPPGTCVDGRCAPCQNAGECAERTCMSVACTMGTCTYSPVEADTPCDDGVYCNGPDACDAFGECTSERNTNPCLEGHRCDEDLDDCVITGGACEGNCAQLDDECRKGICNGNNCEGQALPNGTLCGLVGRCEEGQCVECADPTDCGESPECHAFRCENRRCVEEALPPATTCRGVGSCRDGFCRLPCPDVGLCSALNADRVDCFEPEGPETNYCAECTSEADCEDRASPLCLGGTCGCAVDADCGHLTVDGCDYESECAPEGQRVMRSTVGQCNVWGRCEAVAANGPCRRETENQPCGAAASVCRGGFCQDGGGADQVSVDIHCDAPGWVRFECGGTIHVNQACDFDRVVLCDADAPFRICCTGATARGEEEPCEPGSMVEVPPPPGAADRMISVVPFNQTMCDMMAPPFDQRCSGTLDVDTSIRCNELQQQ